jgi:tetratricopeptide (TPR) repeat protein
MPLWKRQLHPALFLGIVALCFLALGATVIALKAKAPSVPTVNVQAEKQHARERELREEGTALLRQGRVSDAYAKFAELNRMAPNSPAVIATLQKLNSIRAQEEIGRQQQSNAKAKFDEGMALYNQKKYAESIPLFSEAFSLNPNSEDAANYLKLAQQEQQNMENAKAEARQRRLTTTTSGQQARTTTTTTAPQPQPGHTTATGGDGANHSATSAAPVQFNTFFNSPFADGYVTVKVGADVIAREQLFSESRFLHRKSPKTVNVTTNITPKNSDIDVMVVVPSLQIQEHHIIPRVNLQPGSAHRLTITADAASKKFDYSLN